MLRNQSATYRPVRRRNLSIYPALKEFLQDEGVGLSLVADARLPIVSCLKKSLIRPKSETLFSDWNPE